MPSSSDFDDHVQPTEPRQREPDVGDVVLGAFRLLERIGVGSFATAYLAHQLGTDRKAVIKVPHRHLLEGESGQQIRKRFAAELRASSRVNHPNIATVYTAGDSNGIPIIAMEYVPGSSLRKVLKAQAPLPPRSVAKLGQQIASALVAIHAADIVHRDVTPGNVIASSAPNRSERYVLLDFGVARLSDRPSQTIGPLGTPRYMPREQIHGRTVPQSDMFALGAVLWWAVTGREYLDTIDDVHSLLLHQIQRVESPDPRLVLPSLADPVAEAIVELMQRDAGKRPTARKFVEIWPEVMRRWAEILELRRSAPLFDSEPTMPAPVASASVASEVASASVASASVASASVASASVASASVASAPVASASVASAPVASASGPALPRTPVTMEEFGAFATPEFLPPAAHGSYPLPADDDTEEEGVDEEQTVELHIDDRQVTALVVDQNPVRRSAVVAALAHRECEVVESPPDDAPRIASERPPDLVLVAQSLGDLSGMEVLQAIRQSAGWRSWPTAVLLCRRDAAPANWERVAEHCINLPEEHEELLRIIDLLRPASERAPASDDDSASIVAPKAIRSLRHMGQHTMRSTVAHFAGAMPEWLEDMREAIPCGDTATVARVARLIGDSGDVFGARQLSRLSAILAQLASNGLLDQLAGYIEEIEGEFNRVFRELLVQLEQTD